MVRIKNLIKKRSKPSIKKKSEKTPGKALTILGLSILMLGLIVMPTGFVLADVIQDEIDKGVAEQVSVPTDKDSEEYDEWVSNDYKDAPEYYRTFYLWDLTNPDDFFVNGSNPIYEEVGPFVFREYTNKYDIDFSDEESEVSYKQYSTFVQVYGDDLSKVEITNINPAYLGAQAKGGGTDEGLVRLMFPLVLKTLREQFVEEYLKALPTKFGQQFMATGIKAGYLPPGGDEIPEELWPTYWPATEPCNLSGAQPAITVFYEKWANDYFPETGHYLDNETVMGVCAQSFGNVLVNKDGSEHDIGVDIDGREPYNYHGSETDLNISKNDLNYYNIGGKLYRLNDGGSGLTQSQCRSLWNEIDPYSLTGYNYEENKIWFEALDDNTASRTFLMDRFDIDDDQLDYIVNWMNLSCRTWARNVADWQLRDWNSWFITTRTAEEWLFTANDTAAYEYYKYYGEDTNQAIIGIFDNIHNEAEADLADVDHFTINTGKEDISEVGQVVEYKGKDTINIWAGPIEITGTLGTQFAPGVTEGDTLEVFNVDLMRVVELEYEEDTEIYDIDLLQFKLAEDTWAPNSLYFMDTTGLVNLAPVEKYQQVPVRVSNPHFLGTALSVQQGVIGMRPNDDFHETYVNVEPITGIVMDAAMRAQINFEVEPNELFLPNISNTVMPILWMEFRGEIPKDLAEIFKDELYWALDLKEKLPLYCLGLGAALCIPGAAITANQEIKRRKYKKGGLTKNVSDKVYAPIRKKIMELEKLNKLYLEQLETFQTAKSSISNTNMKIKKN
ncbi:MAG: hypothetical protein ACFFAS_20980 [Promethearchaeota archaeon]